ncbi:MAG: hypothetical protein JO148_11060 [Acidimicrobiia bacterium]|nr:hypothetical protein [Acidimicrobiia bacterium]
MIGTASGGFLVAGALGFAMPSQARADVAPGTGSSYAQSFQITPHEGALAVGVVLGEALAGHTNGVARAQSQGEDLGSIGLSLEGYNCGTAPSATQVALVPQALQTETGASNASGQTVQPSDGFDKLSPSSFPPSWGSTEHVQADNKPYGEADTSYGLVDGGAFSVAGMTSKAFSGLVNGQRVAGATSDIGALNFAAGAVVLKQLHWEVTYPSSGGAPPTASFSIGQATIGGSKIPTADPSAVITAVNKVLGTLGIEIDLPAVSQAQGVMFVSPLQIQVVPNDTRDKILLAAIVPGQAAEHPIAQGLEDGFSPSEPQQLVAETCQSDTPITVADITIASIDGGGYFSAGFGGVNATSGELAANPFSLSPFSPSSTPGSSSVVGGTQGIAGTAGTPGTPASDLASTQPQTAVEGLNTSRGGTTGRAVPAAAIGPKANGPLLAIGLGGLALLAALIEADRRVMRRTHAFDVNNFQE